MAEYSLLEQGQVGGAKRLLYDQAAQRVASNDPSRDVVDTQTSQHTVYLALMNYNYWAQELTFQERLNKRFGGDEAHCEYWFSDQSHFPRIAVTSIRGDYRPRRSSLFNPLCFPERLYQWVWKGPTVGDGVACKVRNFTNPYYKYYGLQLTPNEIDRLFMFSFEQDGKPFNMLGNIRCWNKYIYRKTTGTKWYCAELAHAGFQSAGIYDRLVASGHVDETFVNRDPGSVTPALLYEHLCAPGKEIVTLTHNHILGETLADKHFNGSPPLYEELDNANTSGSSLKIVRTSRRKPSKKGKRR